MSIGYGTTNIYRQLSHTYKILNIEMFDLYDDIRQYIALMKMNVVVRNEDDIEIYKCKYLRLNCVLNELMQISDEMNYIQNCIYYIPPPPDYKFIFYIPVLYKFASCNTHHIHEY